MRLSILAAIFLASLSPAFGAEKLLCITDKSTGFKFNGREWAITNFRVSDDKYIVGIDPDMTRRSQKDVYSVKTFKDGTLESFCGQIQNDTLDCDWPSRFEINLKTMRFVSEYPFGYVDGVDDGKNTPALRIGTCARIP